jgi:hypothetical protein
VYTPNIPLNRLRWVEKTYGARRPRVVYDTIRAALSTLGIDTPLRGDWSGHVHEGSFGQLVDMLGVGLNPYSAGQVEPEDWQDVLVELAPVLGDPSRELAQYDFVFPWMAKELARYHKRAEKAWQRVPSIDRRTGAVPEWSQEYEHALEVEGSYRHVSQAFLERGGAIAQWADVERVDLTKLEAHEVLDAVANWTAPAEVPTQGPVVFEFDDGWTVQDLMSREALQDEGEVMQHCVGTYCRTVEAGRAVIYSLRDPRGMPHVTMEYDPAEGKFYQIYGKQNQPPKREYAARVREFLLAGADTGPGTGGVPPGGWAYDIKAVLTYGGAPDLDFSGVDLAGWAGAVYPPDLRRANLQGQELAFSFLGGADLRGANLQFARMTGANLGGADLREADLNYARLDDVEAADARFDDATLVEASLNGAKLQRASFRDATLVGASLYGVSIHDADFAGADLEGLRASELVMEAIEHSLRDEELREEIERRRGA